MTPAVYLERAQSATEKLDLIRLRTRLAQQVENGDLAEAAKQIIDSAINARWDELFPRNTGVGKQIVACVDLIGAADGADHHADTHTSRRTRFPVRKHIASPDREKSRLRRRQLGLSRAMPDSMAQTYTEALRSVGAVIAEQHIVHGHCTLAVDAIAAKAGTCPSTVRNYRVDATKRGEITVIERPVRGGPNDTNVIRIADPAWLRWLKKRAKIGRGIGCKGFNPLESTKRRYNKPDSFRPVDKSGDDPRICGEPPVCREALSGAPS